MLQTLRQFQPSGSRERKITWRFHFTRLVAVVPACTSPDNFTEVGAHKPLTSLDLKTSRPSSDKEKQIREHLHVTRKAICARRCPIADVIYAIPLAALDDY